MSAREHSTETFASIPLKKRTAKNEHGSHIFTLHGQVSSTLQKCTRCLFNSHYGHAQETGYAKQVDERYF